MKLVAKDCDGLNYGLWAVEIQLELRLSVFVSIAIET